ncbi:MAG: hypothetical protein IMW92_05900 [Bacillales bacterium]|nr:hypothetical protein [Bacillales bacterium]
MYHSIKLETLDQLMKEQETFDVLFIEGTGVANPFELMEVLLLQPPYSILFDIFSIISVIDGGNFLSHLSISPRRLSSFSFSRIKFNVRFI